MTSAIGLFVVAVLLWGVPRLVSWLLEEELNELANLSSIAGVVCGGLAVGVACMSCVSSVPPGHVGVVINLWGEERGVQNEERGVGYYFIPPWRDMYLFPVFEQNYTWESDVGEFPFQTCEGLPITANVGITYHLDGTKIHTLFCRYRRGMDEITEVFIRNLIRDQINRHASKMGVEDLYSEKKELFCRQIEEGVKAELEPLGICVSRIYLIGNLHFPESVSKALNHKIEATQRAQQRENELREAKAEAEKEVAEKEGLARSMEVMARAKAAQIEIEAQAQARSNKLLADSLTPALVRSQEIQKWNGALPHYVGSGVVPFLKMGASKDSAAPAN